MSELKATPGPWAYSPDVIDTFGNESVTDALGCVVATVVDDGQTDEQTVANAHLIASAPTMADYVRRRAEGGCSEAAAIWETVCGR